jgi:hypothetical protein
MPQTTGAYVSLVLMLHNTDPDVIACRAYRDWPMGYTRTVILKLIRAFEN